MGEGSDREGTDGLREKGGREGGEANVDKTRKALPGSGLSFIGQGVI